MAVFTGRNKDNYFQTELPTVQIIVSQPSFHRTSLGVSIEVVELINREFEIPQQISNSCLSKKNCEQVGQIFDQEFNICAKRIKPKCLIECKHYIDLRCEVHFDV
jgi:hypothetical protein